MHKKMQVRALWSHTAKALTQVKSSCGYAHGADQFSSCQSSGGLRRQLLEQRLRLLQIVRVEPFGEPAVDRSEQFAGLLRLALVTPEARHAHRGAEFPGLCFLLPRQ